MCVGSITNPDVPADWFYAFDSDEDDPGLKLSIMPSLNSLAMPPPGKLFSDPFPSHVSTGNQHFSYQLIAIAWRCVGLGSGCCT